MHCPSCGEEIPDDSEFCRHCGTAIEQEIPSEPQDSLSDEPKSESNSVWIGRAGTVVAYLVGAFFFLSAIGAAADSILAALVMLAGGIITLPIVRTKLSESTGITLGTWATVAIVIVVVVAGSGLYQGAADSPNPETAGSPEATDSPTATPQPLIEKSATDLVIQLDQLEAGWSGSPGGNDSHAEGRYFESQDDIVLQTTVDKYGSIDTATAEYTERVEEVQSQHATETVNVGEEGVLYLTSNSAWVIFRDRNVVAELRYTTEFGTDREGNARDFAELMYENFPE